MLRFGALIGVNVMTLLAALGAEGGAQVTAPPANMPNWSPEVELVRALGWPIVALVVAILIRQPFSEFVIALGSRITKLSVFKVELELVPAVTAAAPLLDDIRTATTSVMIRDSLSVILQQVQSQSPADCAEIDLDAGKKWLTSRLFIAAVMLERMRGAQVLVFHERTPQTYKRFVAVASIAQVRWALAQRFPWLEAAWVRAYIELFPIRKLTSDIPTPKLTSATPLPAGAIWPPEPREMVSAPSPITSGSGALTPQDTIRIVGDFVESLQEKKPLTAQEVATEWTPLGEMRERATWVTRDLLREMLAPEAFRLSTEEAGRDAPRARRTRAVLRCPGPFVALVEGDREYVRLVKRRVLLEEIAASLGEEPEGVAH